MGVDLQDRFIKLRDLSVDEGLQRLLQPVVIPLQLPLVLFLVWTNQTFVLTQGILTSFSEKDSKMLAYIKNKPQFTVHMLSHHLWIIPLCEIFEAEPELIVVSVQFWVTRDL